jgi:hypothetical protein
MIKNNLPKNNFTLKTKRINSMNYKNLFIIILLFLFTILSNNYCLSQWSIPVDVSPAYKGYSDQPSITAINNKILIAWLQRNDLSDTTNEIFSREFYQNNWSAISSVSKVLSNAGHPSATSDIRGVYHVVWGERTNYNKPIPFHPPTDVFYSRWENSDWMEPQNISHKVDSIYHNFIAPKIITDTKDRIHVIWGEQSPTGGATFLKYRMQENKDWGEIKTLPIHCAYFDFDVDNNGRIHLAYITAAKTSTIDMNSIFYCYTDDLGKTWADTVLVHLSGNDPGFEVKIAIDRNNTIHLTWTKQIGNNEDFGLRDVMHSFSIDGKNWSQPVMVSQPLKGYTSYPNIISDSKNQVHLVFDWRTDAFDSHYFLYYCLFNGKEWTLPTLIFNDDCYRESNMCIDKFDYLHLAFIKFSSSDKSVKVCYSHTLNPVTSIKLIKDKPQALILNQNYPNPFNPTTNIKYQVPSSGFVTLKIYDVLGKEISVLVNKIMEPGIYFVQFDGSKLSSGTYFYRLEVTPADGDKKITIQKSMLLMK